MRKEEVGGVGRKWEGYKFMHVEFKSDGGGKVHNEEAVTLSLLHNRVLQRSLPQLLHFLHLLIHVLDGL